MNSFSVANYHRPRSESQHFLGRILFLTGFSLLVFFILIARLFQLQIMRHSDYSAIAKEQHFGAVDLPARRGEILVRDRQSGELTRLATNTTLDLVYVDPLVAEDKPRIARLLAPLLFSQAVYQECTSAPLECAYDIEEPPDPEALEPSAALEPAPPIVWDITPQDPPPAPTLPIHESLPVRLKSYSRMLEEVEMLFLKKISQDEVDFVVLAREADDALLAAVRQASLPGILIEEKTRLIHADPTLIPPTSLTTASRTLAELLKKPAAELENQMSRRKVRYVPLARELSPETSRAIRELSLKGVVLLPEYHRFYPEQSLAAHVVGFLSQEEGGQYGVEGYFNSALQGKKGVIYAESDPFGRKITVGEGEIINAVDGDSLVLTLDRIVQKHVEELLAEETERYRADSGQILVMNPFTGAIVAMAAYPTFDPNHFAEAYTLRRTTPNETLYPTTPLFYKDEKGRYVPISRLEKNDPAFMENLETFVYENRLGPEVFKNKMVSDVYEPGSVFKPLIMSVALDANEVDPEDTFLDDGPVKVDEFTIKNSTGQYHGITTMTEVLEKSLNTGMSFVAQKLGSQMMYEYLKKFGFGQYTNLPLEGENKGGLDFYRQWSLAQLLTTSFGQGIVVTPLQMVAAWSALANGGNLVQPTIIESIIRASEVIKTEPQIIQRVISEEAASLISAMLVNVVNRSYSRTVKTDRTRDYKIAGKTGTAQIAGLGGRYEKGEGSTITSFGGFFPALNPQFVILVKYDRPRIGAGTWGETTAGITFGKLAEFLIEHYHIQPE